MNKTIALALLGALSFANAEGTTNPVIIGKLQDILANQEKV